MLTAHNIFKLIRAKFPLPTYAVFQEVGNSTGHECKRHADAIAITLWPSRGLELQGFEIKCHRSDWVKELKDPAKSHEIQKFCDRWWIVVNDENIVKDGELPPTWGLLVPKGNSLNVKVTAPKLNPEPLNVPFVAAILRRQAEAVDSEINRAVALARQEGIEEGKKYGPPEFKHERERLLAEIETLKHTINEFNRQSGVQLNTWNYGDVGDAVKKLLLLRHKDPITALKSILFKVEQAKEYIKENIEIYENI